jgi:hypothetical protein
MTCWTVPGRYDFSIAEAQRLSDLNGIEGDLAAVVRLCERWQKLAAEIGSPQEGNGLEWWERTQDLGDLGFAAVVRYGRSFNSGTRSGVLPEVIASLGENHSQSHTYFKVLRDKYIAHSVSELEDNQVFVMLSPQFGEPQVPGHITVDRGRLIGLGVPDIRRLKVLADAVREAVNAEITIESAKLLTIASSMSIEEIKARGNVAVPIPSKNAAFKVRGKFPPRGGDA